MAKSPANKPQPDKPSAEKKTVAGLRPHLVLAALLLVGLGGAARLGWDVLHGALAFSSRYQLTAETIHVLPEQLPPWIRTDVKAEVLRDADLENSASMLDDPAELHQRLVGAFELHPWIERVERVEFVGPKRIDIQLRYREPVAVVRLETGGPRGELLTVDLHATRLPDGDLSDIEKSYMPRIVDIQGRPLVGEPWTDLRVIGAVRLAARLKPVWERYRLMEIIPSTGPEFVRSDRYYTYDIRTTGGTLIRWGSAPELGPPGESTFEEKLARLASYITEYGPLDSVSGPKEIDVRRQLAVIAKDPAATEEMPLR